jgi:hypothetical protein
LVSVPKSNPLRSDAGSSAPDSQIYNFDMHLRDVEPSQPGKSSLLDRGGSGRSPDYRREGRGDDGEAGESHRRDVDLFFFSMSLGVYAVGKGKESDERWM